MTNPSAAEVAVLSKASLFAAPLPALTGSDQPGYDRTAYRGLTGPTFRTTVIAVPPGQGSTPRDSTFDHVLMVLSGSLEFEIDGEIYQVDEWGQILVPTGVTWHYTNPTGQAAVYLSVVGAESIVAA